MLIRCELSICLRMNTFGSCRNDMKRIRERQVDWKMIIIIMSHRSPNHPTLHLPSCLPTSLPSHSPQQQAHFDFKSPQWIPPSPGNGGDKIQHGVFASKMWVGAVADFGRWRVNGGWLVGKVWIGLRIRAEWHSCLVMIRG